MLRSSKRSGRISFVLLAGLCSVAMITVLFLFSGETPTTAATQFMNSLATGDAKGLAKYSVIHDLNQEQRQKAWEETLKYSRTYLFHWTIASVRDDGKTATAKLEYVKNPLGTQSYAEHFELALEKT